MLREAQDGTGDLDPAMINDAIMANPMIDMGSIQIDLMKLLSTRLLVQGTSGAGKSYMLRRLLEQTSHLVQQVIIDVEGEFASLREVHPYLYCAVGAAIQPRPQWAADLALKVRQTRASIIIDLYDLDLEDRKLYAAKFLTALLEAPRELWKPCLVVVDEAHCLAPQRGFAVPKGEPCAKKAIDGRKRGLCLIAGTQRISKLHKDVAAELANICICIGATGLRNDLATAADQLGITPKEAVALLRPLPSGNFFVFGPAISKEVAKMIVGPVQTRHGTDALRALIPTVKDLDSVQGDLEKREAEEAQKEATLAAQRQAAESGAANQAPQPGKASPARRQKTDSERRAIVSWVRAQPVLRRAVVAAAKTHDLSESSIYLWLKRYPAPVKAPAARKPSRRRKVAPRSPRSASRKAATRRGTATKRRLSHTAPRRASRKG